MIIVNLLYSCKELKNMGEITEGLPYGGGTLSGSDGHPTTF